MGDKAFSDGAPLVNSHAYADRDVKPRELLQDPMIKGGERPRS